MLGVLSRVMINKDSVKVLEAARSGHRVHPQYGSYCFDGIPSTICSLFGLPPLTSSPALPLASCLDIPPANNIVLLFFDAFGYRMLEQSRHIASVQKFFGRIESDGILSLITSQFPSTTAAHVTTIQSGYPVYTHGIYEWYMYESTIGEMIASIPSICISRPANANQSIRAADYLPDSIFHAALAQGEVKVHSVLHESYANSSYNTFLGRRSHILPYSTLKAGFKSVRDKIAASQEKKYFLFYADIFDYTCHRFGPGAAETDAAAENFFTALQNDFISELPANSNTTLIITADHGQVRVDPHRIHYLDREAPELEDLLQRLPSGIPMTPAGSPRDYFLHLKPDALSDGIAFLRKRLNGIAEVLPTSELIAAGIFGDKNKLGKLATNLANAVILPLPGESIFWAGEDGQFCVNYHGNHGGLSQNEMESLFGILPL